jgi:hypothetical protein
LARTTVPVVVEPGPNATTAIPSTSARPTLLACTTLPSPAAIPMPTPHGLAGSGQLAMSVTWLRAITFASPKTSTPNPLWSRRLPAIWLPVASSSVIAPFVLL